MAGYLSKELIDDELVDPENEESVSKICFKLAKKCWEEFKRTERELEDDPDLKILWDQRFICTAAVLCFRELTL